MMDNERTSTLVQPFTITSYNQDGQPVYVKQPHGQRFTACCLQETPCAWHAQHGDEILQEPAPEAVARRQDANRKRKPTPKPVQSWLTDPHGGVGMFEDADELYDHLLEKRKQWEQNPDVGWIPYLMYMVIGGGQHYEAARNIAYAMSRWIDCGRDNSIVSTR